VFAHLGLFQVSCDQPVSILCKNALHYLLHRHHLSNALDRVQYDKLCDRL